MLLFDIHRPLPHVYEYTPRIQDIYAGRRQIQARIGLVTVQLPILCNTFSYTFYYSNSNSVSVVPKSPKSPKCVLESLPIWLWPLLRGEAGTDGVSGEKGEKGWPGYPGDQGEKGLPGGNSMQKGFKGDKGAERNKVSRALQLFTPCIIISFRFYAMST